MHIMHPPLHGFDRCGHAASTGGHLQVITAGAVDLADEINEAKPLIVVFGKRFDKHGARPIAE